MTFRALWTNNKHVVAVVHWRILKAKASIVGGGFALWDDLEYLGAPGLPMCLAVTDTHYKDLIPTDWVRDRPQMFDCKTCLGLFIVVMREGVAVKVSE